MLCGAHDSNMVTMDEGHGGQKNEKIKVRVFFNIPQSFFASSNILNIIIFVSVYFIIYDYF